jgi:hypothetical protein
MHLLRKQRLVVPDSVEQQPLALSLLLVHGRLNSKLFTKFLDGMVQSAHPVAQLSGLTLRRFDLGCQPCDLLLLPGLHARTTVMETGP